jgi:hypothetical protein
MRSDRMARTHSEAVSLPTHSGFKDEAQGTWQQNLMSVHGWHGW